MDKVLAQCKYLFVVTLVFVSFAIGQTVLSQHESHNMPGMSKSKPKVKAKVKRKTATRRKSPFVRKRPAAKHNISRKQGQKAPPIPPASDGNANIMSVESRPEIPPIAVPSHERIDPDVNMPGMQMPASSPSPNQQASPQKMDMNMPIPSASPGASPHAHTPEPTPASPAASPEKMDMNMRGMTMSSPQARTELEPRFHTTGQPSPNFGAMNIGPLMVLYGNDVGIRVGSSGRNLISMGAMGSGTTWQPSSGPMHMLHKQSGDWLLMFHYNAVVGVNSQGGPRGVSRFESANWFMPMAFRRVGPGTLQLRSMFSFEPFTFPRGGSPLLFQTGETYKGQPLIDRQHPHDLFMELSAQYTLPLGERGTWFTYFGYPGEPALGPVAFMHRASASENSSAPLAHHLQDSTHISFGVLTTGFTYRWLKLEGSVFNGREPDENRYNFDAHKWNSRSVRLSIMPNANWTAQVSYGFLRNPESQEPDTDIRRATASLQYNRSFNRGSWASAFVWGRNHTNRPGEMHNLNAYTLESTANFLDKNYIYTRLELVDKNELLRPADRALLGISDDHPSFRIGAYTFGGARDVWSNDKVSMAIGSDLTFYSKPAVLDQIYGSDPVSWKMFFRVRPGKMDMSAHGAHGNMDMTTKP